MGGINLDEKVVGDVKRKLQESRSHADMSLFKLTALESVLDEAWTDASKPAVLEYLKTCTDTYREILSRIVATGERLDRTVAILKAQDAVQLPTQEHMEGLMQQLRSARE